MTRADLLARVARGELTIQQAGELLNAQKPPRPLRASVTRKGAIALHGVRKLPIAFYPGEWEQILGAGELIRRELPKE